MEWHNPHESELGRRRLLTRLGVLGASAAAVGLASPAAATAAPDTDSGLGGLRDVTEFGAIGDGQRDDASAIQAAINAVATAGGGEVYLHPRRTYRLGRPLQLKSGVTLTSARTRANLVLSDTYSAEAVLELNSVQAVTISNLDIDCGDRSGVTRCIRAVGCDNVRFESLHVKGITTGSYVPTPGVPSTQLIRVESSHHVDIIDCVLRDAYVGMHVTGNCSHITIDRCDLTRITYFGIHILGGVDHHTEYATVQRCRLTEIGGRPGDVGYPIYITCGGNNPAAQKHRFIQTSDNEIIGNKMAYGDGGNADLLALYDIFDGIAERNIVLYGGDAGVSTDRCRKLVIANNIAAYCNTVGINVWQTNETTVVGNLVYNNHQDYNGKLSKEPRGGIRTYARVNFKTENVVMVGNRCWDDQATRTQDYGIFLHARSRGIDVGTNMLAGNRDGLLRSAATDVTLSFTTTLDAIPTSGYWEKGMVVQLRNPAAGQPDEWICSAAGTPGTWRPKSAFGVATATDRPPVYIGQFAVSGNALFIGVGTASAADWREVSVANS